MQSPIRFFSISLNLFLMLLTAFVFSQTDNNPALSLADTVTGNHYYTKGDSFLTKGEFDSAYYYLNQAGSLYKSLAKTANTQTIWEAYVRTLYRKSVVHMQIGNVSKMAAYAHQALTTARANLGEMNNETANCYRLFGLFYLYTGKYDSALVSFDKELGILKSLNGEKDITLVKGLLNCATTYYQKGHYDKVETFSYKALEILKLADQEQSVETANVYINLSGAYVAIGDFEIAAGLMAKAISVLETILGGNNPNILKPYMNLGIVHFKKGDYKTALNYYEKALALGLPVFTEQHPEIADLYNNIGLVYHKQGADSSALVEFHKALAIKEKLFAGQFHQYIANILYNIGKSYFAVDSADKALTYFQQSLRYYQAHLGEEGHIEIPGHYIQVGHIYASKQNDAIARSYYQRAAAYYQKHQIRGHINQAWLHQEQGQLAEKSGEYRQAVDYYQQALGELAPGFDYKITENNPPVENLQSAQEVVKTLNMKARALYQMSQNMKSRPINEAESRAYLVMALSTYYRAIEIVDKIQISYHSEESQYFWAEKLRDVYINALHTAEALFRKTGDEQYREAAFNIMEKSKAAILSAAVQEAQAKNFAGIPDSLLEAERRLKIRIAFYETEVAKAAAGASELDSSQVQHYQNRLFSQNRLYEQLKQRLETDYPQYYALKYNRATITLSDLQSVLDDSSTIIEYMISDSAVYIFTIAKQKYTLNRVRIDNGLAKNISQFRNGLITGIYQDYLETGYQLYQTLIEPVASLLTTKHIIIIPDGFLNDIPFEALLTAKPDQKKAGISYGSLPFLIKEYVISYVHSATLLQEQLQPLSKAPENNYLAFAPVFEASQAPNSLRGTNFVQNNGESSLLIPLPASEKAVKNIAEMHYDRYGFFAGGYYWLFTDKIKTVLHNEASEKSLKSNSLASYRYLHFSTHAFANYDVPGLSGLVFAQVTDSTEDNILYLSEIYNLSLNADLVILDACETGTGKLVAGEGLIGLNRGFLYAGAKNLLVSQWQTSDTWAGELMQTFFRHLFKTGNKAAALQAAKLVFINSEKNAENGNSGTKANPKHWAPFILIGR